jgi:tryptophanyl-tRNA synthetase
LILAHFAEARQRFDALINDKAYLDQVLMEGAAKARAMAKPYLAAARKATGID